MNNIINDALREKLIGLFIDNFENVYLILVSNGSSLTDDGRSLVPVTSFMQLAINAIEIKYAIKATEVDSGDVPGATLLDNDYYIITSPGLATVSYNALYLKFTAVLPIDIDYDYISIISDIYDKLGDPHTDTLLDATELSTNADIDNSVVLMQASVPSTTTVDGEKTFEVIIRF